MKQIWIASPAGLRCHLLAHYAGDGANVRCGRKLKKWSIAPREMKACQWCLRHVKD